MDKRKRLEEEALSKKLESESNYRASVDEANERHRNLLLVKSEVLQQVRELILQCDQTMKAVTVSYFHLQYTLTAPVPTQFQVKFIWYIAIKIQILNLLRYSYSYK